MTTPIEIRELPAQRLLLKNATCPHNQIGPTFGKTIGQVSQCMRASSAKMSSAPMAVCLRWRDSDCDMAIGCKIDGDVTLTNDCEWLDLPAGPHAFASHFGPYDQLQETHKAVRDWCTANNEKITGPCFETYPTDPGLEPDPAKWQTGQGSSGFFRPGTEPGRHPPRFPNRNRAQRTCGSTLCCRIR